MVKKILISLLTITSLSWAIPPIVVELGVEAVIFGIEKVEAQIELDKFLDDEKCLRTHQCLLPIQEKIFHDQQIETASTIPMNIKYDGSIKTVQVSDRDFRMYIDELFQYQGMNPFVDGLDLWKKYEIPHDNIFQEDLDIQALKRKCEETEEKLICDIADKKEFYDALTLLDEDMFNDAGYETLTQKAKNGNIQATVKLNEVKNFRAKSFYNNGGYEKAFTLFEETCDNDNVVGCTSLAYMYEKGIGVVENYDIAKSLYEKACEQVGGGISCNNAGFLALQKLRIKDGNEDNGGNEGEAMGFFDDACSMGIALGCQNLALLNERLLTFQAVKNIQDSQGDLMKGVFERYEQACSLFLTSEQADENKIPSCKKYHILEWELRSSIEDNDLEAEDQGE